jgi:fucose permease
MGVFSYIADITTEEERTLRIGIVNLCFSLGVPIGMAFSGVLLKYVTVIKNHMIRFLSRMQLACDIKMTKTNNLLPAFFSVSRRNNDKDKVFESFGLIKMSFIS